MLTNGEHPIEGTSHLPEVAEGQLGSFGLQKVTRGRAMSLFVDDLDTDGEDDNEVDFQA